MRMGGDVYIHLSLPSALAEGEWSVPRSAAIPLGKKPQYALDRRLGGPQSRSGDLEKRKFLILPGLELWSLGHPARIQSLYGLRYPGSKQIK
jgi:hypothetical protein